MIDAQTRNNARLREFLRPTLPPTELWLRRKVLRFLLVISFVVVVVYAAGWRVWLEIKDIPFYVKSDVLLEIDALKGYWRDTREGERHV